MKLSLFKGANGRLWLVVLFVVLLVILYVRSNTYEGFFNAPLAACLASIKPAGPRPVRPTPRPELPLLRPPATPAQAIARIKENEAIRSKNISDLDAYVIRDRAWPRADLDERAARAVCTARHPLIVPHVDNRPKITSKIRF